MIAASKATTITVQLKPAGTEGLKTMAKQERCSITNNIGLLNLLQKAPGEPNKAQRKVLETKRYRLR